jgi:Zn finger protein HypA/HybF involved in hydrogenase expression
MNTKEQVFLNNLNEIKSLISQNKPRAEISRFVGLNYDTLVSYFKKYGIDYKGNQSRKGMTHNEVRVPLEKILSNEVTYKTKTLRERLIECGLKENKCECCGITSWNDKPIVFELHHKDGNHYNNNLDNLEVLCPNCHSQTDFFRGRNCKVDNTDKGNENIDADEILNEIKDIKQPEREAKKKRVLEKKYCECCGAELVNMRNRYCSVECFRKINSQNRPTVTELINVLNEQNWNLSSTGRHYGVSDAAVRKWIKLYKIEK